MKTLNFNILQKFIIVFCLSLLGISCSTDSINESSGDSLKLGKSKMLWDPKLVAEKHNEGLEKLYQNLLDCDLSHQAVSNKCLFNQTIDFVENEGLSEEYIKNIMYVDNRVISKFEKNEILKFSPEFQKEYFSIKEIFMNDKQSDLEKLNRLKSRVVSTSVRDDWEKVTLETYIEVGKSSLTYWMENGDKWLNKTRIKNFSKLKFNWSAIGFSDAAGAVASAVGLAVNGTGAAMIAAAGPAGVAGVGLVIAASAIISSASAFTGQAIFGGWFD